MGFICPQFFCHGMALNFTQRIYKLPCVQGIGLLNYCQVQRLLYLYGKPQIHLVIAVLLPVHQGTINLWHIITSNLYQTVSHKRQQGAEHEFMLLRIGGGIVLPGLWVIFHLEIGCYGVVAVPSDRGDHAVLLRAQRMQAARCAG